MDCGFAEEPLGVHVATEKRARVLLTVKEVASYLQVNPTTVYRLLRASEIPAFKVGGDWRFEADRIEAWLRANQRGNDTVASRGGPFDRRYPEPNDGEHPSNSLDHQALASKTLVRLHQAISQIIAPLGELQATLPALKRIAERIEDRRDPTSDIAELFDGGAIPFLPPSQALLKDAPFGFAMVNQQLKLVDFNEAYCRLVGYRSKHLRRRPLDGLVHEEDRAGYLKSCSHMMSGKIDGGDFLVRGLSSEGAPIPLRAQIWTVRRDLSSKPKYLAAILRKVASKADTSEVFSRCTEKLSRRRDRVLSGS